MKKNQTTLSSDIEANMFTVNFNEIIATNMEEYLLDVYIQSRSDGTISHVGNKEIIVVYMTIDINRR